MAKVTSMPTVIGALKAICTAAQTSAFPDIASKVDVASSAMGADYQNNSALSLFGRLKAAGLPDGIKSPKDVAQRLADAMQLCDSEAMMAKVEVAGAGFINITISGPWFADRLNTIAQNGALPPPVLVDGMPSPCTTLT